MTESVIMKLIAGLPEGEKLEAKQGGAPGADKIATRCLMNQGVFPEYFPYIKGFGKGGGPARNKKMLDSGCDGVIAFKDNFDFTLKQGEGHGTEDMVRQSIDLPVSWVRLFGSTGLPQIWTPDTFWITDHEFWKEPEE